MLVLTGPSLISPSVISVDSRPSGPYVGPIRHRANYFVLVLTPKMSVYLSTQSLPLKWLFMQLTLSTVGWKRVCPLLCGFFSINPVLFSIRGWESGGRLIRGRDLTDSSVFSLSLSP